MSERRGDSPRRVATDGVVYAITRRSFLRGVSSAAGGLVLGVVLPAGAARAVDASPPVATGELGPSIRIEADGGVVIRLERVEMGQGVHTALAQLVAEELEVAWQRVRVETIGLDGPSAWIPGTVASTSVRASWRPLRTAGAAARELLIAAAAAEWEVEPDTCMASSGAVFHGPSGRRLDYAQLVTAAALLPLPAEVPLKPSGSFELIGRSLQGAELHDKVTGTAQFGIDATVDGMLYAAIAMSPSACGELVSADRAAAEGSAGVRAVVDLPGAIAVVADHYWQARSGLAALAPEFEAGDPNDDSATHSARLHAALETPGVEVFVRAEGEPPGARAQRGFGARYEVPLLAHATMEPMNCTAAFADGRCELWVSTQAASRNRQAVAEALDLPHDAVTVHPMLLGGGLGRRVESDFCVQASLLSRAVGRPVKLVWSREDDIRHDFYRPACAAHLEATLDAAGRPLTLRMHTAGPWYDRELPRSLRDAVGWAEKQLEAPLAPRSLPDFLWWRLPSVVRSGFNGMVSGNGSPFRYAVDHQRREYSLVECGVRIGWWRSVSASQGAFFTESFMDELAHAAGVDPWAYRRRLLSGRGLAVLDRAAAMAHWSRPRPPGRGVGIAYQTLFDSFVCQVAEVEVDSSGALRVLHVWCAVDCGIAVNPDGVIAQIEGGILFGLSAALRERVDVIDGRVAQGNFDDYRLLGLAETPTVEVEIVDSGADPGGIGELGTPPIAPAVTNAIFAATGRRLRSLPILPLRPRHAGATPG